MKEGYSYISLVTALENGGNNSETRLEVLKLIIDGNLSSEEDRNRLMDCVERGWRSEGEVKEEDLDTRKL